MSDDANTEATAEELKLEFAVREGAPSGRLASNDELRRQGFAFREGGRSRQVGSGRVRLSDKKLPEAKVVDQKDPSISERD